MLLAPALIFACFAASCLSTYIAYIICHAHGRAAAALRLLILISLFRRRDILRAQHFARHWRAAIAQKMRRCLISGPKCLWCLRFEKRRLVIFRSFRYGAMPRVITGMPGQQFLLSHPAIFQSRGARFPRFEEAATILHAGRTPPTAAASALIDDYAAPLMKTLSREFRYLARDVGHHRHYCSKDDDENAAPARIILLSAGIYDAYYYIIERKRDALRCRFSLRIQPADARMSEAAARNTYAPMIFTRSSPRADAKARRRAAMNFAAADAPEAGIAATHVFARDMGWHTTAATRYIDSAMV